MKKWRLIGGIALVFILGLLAGGAGSRLYHEYRLEKTWGDPAARRDFYLKRLTRDLNLNGNQQREFRAIIDDLETRRESVTEKRRTEIREIMDEGFSRMKEKLSPEQQQKLEKLRAAHEQRMKNRKWHRKGL